MGRHVAIMGKSGMHIGFRWESQKERDFLEDLNIGDWEIILKWILDWVGWYGLYSSGSGEGPVEGSCEHDNEYSGSIKC
jgi:hypothetical protein